MKKYFASLCSLLAMAGLSATLAAAPGDKDLDVKIVEKPESTRVALAGSMTKTQDLPPVIVTATKSATRLDEVGISASVISSEEIEKRGNHEVLELLRSVPGLHLVQSGSRGSTTSLFARGGESDYNLVMLDGVKLNLGGGAFDFGNLAADDIERIEVLRGPQSSLYGSDAIASTVNIISKRGRGPSHTAISAMGGTFSTFDERFQTSGGEESFGYALSAGRNASKGSLPLNNQSSNDSFRARFDVDASKVTKLGFTAAYTDSTFNFPTDFVFGKGFQPVDPRQGRETRDYVLGLDAAWSCGEMFEPQLKLGLSGQDQRNFDMLDPIASDFSNSELLNRERHFSIDYRILARTGAYGTWTLGVEREVGEFDQNSSSVSPTRTTASVNSSSRRSYGTYLQDEFDFGERLFFTLGARLDDNSKYGTAVSPRASVAWLFRETGTKLRAAAGRGIKEPTFNENYGTSFSRGNLNLDPERATSWEVGADQALLHEDLRLSATYFNNRYKDMIAYTGGLVGSPTTDFVNLQGAESSGVEAEVRLRLYEIYALGGSHTYLKTEVKDDGGVGAPTFVKGQPLLRRPKNSSALFAEVATGPMSARLDAFLVGTRVDGDFSTFPGKRVNLPSYARFDLSAALKVYENKQRSMKLKLLVENLFDRNYEEAKDFAAPGVSALGGVEVAF